MGPGSAPFSIFWQLGEVAVLFHDYPYRVPIIPMLALLFDILRVGRSLFIQCKLLEVEGELLTTIRRLPHQVSIPDMPDLVHVVLILLRMQTKQ